ncbi:MAG TPA: hypothetical protein VH085_01615 [Nocardioides sp.]|jgi:hypothetical protein|nr:hypothetical protein [Nocardioides sp.]
MRVRRAVGVTAAAALVFGFMVPAAEGAPGSPVVVRGVSALPALTSSAGVAIGSVLCGRAGASDAEQPPLLVDTGLAGTPLGKGVWAMYAPSDDAAYGPERSYGHLSDFTSVSLDVLALDPTDASGSEGGQVYAEARDGATTWWGTAGVASYAAGTGWHTAAADSSTTFEWLPYVAGTTDPVDGLSYTGTVDQLLGQVVHGDQGGAVGVAMGCGGGAFAFDAPAFGVSGTATTYDLETTGSSLAVSDPPAAEVFAGEPVALRGLLADSDGTPFQHGDLTLEARPHGSTGWTVLRHTHVSYDVEERSPAVRVRPLIQTAYRWVPAGPYVHKSLPARILVRPRLRLRSLETVVKRGDQIRLRGSMLPSRPGLRLRLHRGRHVVRRVLVDRHGRFRTTIRATHNGWWTLYLTSGRLPGSRASVSAPVTIRVGVPHIDE